MSSSVIIIGSALVDELFFCDELVIAGTSNPAIVKRNVGGVVSNIAQHLALLELPVEFITVLGNDADASWIKSSFNQIGINSSNSLFVEDNTGKYISILNPDGSLFTAACVDICGKYLSPEFLEIKSDLLKTAEVIIADTNIEIATIHWIIDFAKKNNKRLIIEPVSVAKARKLSSLNLNGLFMVTPNEDELSSLCINKSNDEMAMIDELLSRGVLNVWLRKGAEGSVIYNKNGQLRLNVPEINIVDSTGAGDAALAGWVTALMNNFDELKCLQAGHTLALEVLQIQGAVKHDITKLNFLTAIKTYYKDAK